MTGSGAWIAGSDGNWAALSCGETDRLGEANARLIALAPTLAAHNLSMRNALRRLIDNLDEGDFISTTRIEEARAALHGMGDRQ